MRKPKIEETYICFKERQEKEYNCLPIQTVTSKFRFREVICALGLEDIDLESIHELGNNSYCVSKDIDMITSTLERHKCELEIRKRDYNFVYQMFIHELTIHEFSKNYDVKPALDIARVTLSDLENNPVLRSALVNAKNYLLSRIEMYA